MNIKALKATLKGNFGWPNKEMFFIFFGTIISFVLSFYISKYFYFLSIPLLFFWVYLLELNYAYNEYLRYSRNENYMSNGSHTIKKENGKYIINLLNGKRHGPFIEYYRNGQIKAEGFFDNGKETGVIKTYFKVDNKLENIISTQVINELADLDKGIYEVYSLNGKILERSEIDSVKFKFGKNHELMIKSIIPIRSGLSEKWFENGKLKEKGFWEIYKSSDFEPVSNRKGKHVQFYENGNIFKEGDWIDGYPVDIHKISYPNGCIEFEVKFRGNGFGSIISERWYNENGALMNQDEIIKKGGIIKYGGQVGPDVPTRRLSQIIINENEYERMGIVDFYNLYKPNVGHSYKLI